MGVANAGQQFSAEIWPGIANPAGTGAGSGSAPLGAVSGMTPQEADGMAPRGDLVAQVNVTSLTGGSVSGDQPQIFAAVYATDTAVPAQTDLYDGQDANPLSGIEGEHAGFTTGGQANAGPYGTGHVITPIHWNAARGPRAGAPS